MDEKDEAPALLFHIKLSGLPVNTSIANVRNYLCDECECDVKEVLLQGNNSAVAVIMVKDIDELLKKNHSIKETFISVSLHKDQLELQWDTIKVSGEDDIETLKFYFAGKRSGGNRTKSVESVTKVDTNAVHVKFKSVDDAAAVIAQEKHMITGGSQIHVCYAPVPDSKKYERDKILIKNIPKETKEKTLIALIEGCLDLEFEREFTLNLQAPLALLLLSHHYGKEELQKIAEILASQQIHGNYLNVDLCDVNHSIVVSGISEEKIVGNAFALQFYFETPNSGGGENTVQMLTPTKVKVNFKDPSDVKEFKGIFPEYILHMKVQVTLPTVAVKFLQRNSGQRVLKTITSDSRVFLYFTTDGINQCLYLLHSTEHVSLAEKLADTIKQAIATESCEIPLSFQNQVEGDDYSKFKFNLAEKYSFFSTINENELTVASTAGDVNDVINELMGFINEACSVSETINFSRGVWRLFHTALKVEWSEVKRSLETKGIDIIALSKSDASKPYIAIRGETSAVQQAKEDILSHQVSVTSKKIILSQAGVCSYFLSNNALILKGIENAAGVCIEVEVKGMSSNVFKEIFTGVTDEMMSVHVVVGDLTEFNQAEVMVNAANEELKHRGGVAAVIARKGGSSIQQDSDDYIRRNKKVAAGTAVLFTATGNLPSSYKAIVHAVGPRYRAENKQNSCATLKQTIFQSLELAKNYESIAFPAIGGGNFGFPIAVCANVHFEAVVEFSKTELPTKLRKVYFVIIEGNVEVFLQAAKNYLSGTFLKSPSNFESLRPLNVSRMAPNASSTLSLPPTLSTVAVQQNPKRKTKKHKMSDSGVPELWTRSSIEYIKITKGSITDYPEEALVNTTDENLKLQGYVSKVLLEEAGPNLKKECDALTKPFRIGSVVATKAYKLRKSKHILHVILPNYDGKSEGVLREVVRNCLDECTRLKVKSLSMPSIGAGNLKYPPDIVARVLIEETISFFQKNNGKTTLKLVHFVIYQQDICDEFQKVLRLGQESPRATNFDSKSMQSLLITKGSVTDFQEEAVVLTNDRNLELKGVVGQVLAKQAGPELKKECDALKKPIEFGSVIATKGHSLKAKYILHAILHSCGTSIEESEKVLRKIAVKCLDECTRLKVKSLSMTSIGAGKLGYPNDIVAKALLEETAIYLKKNKGNTTIELVRFVIYEKRVYDEFSKVYQQLSAGATKRKTLLLSTSLQLELVEGEIGNDSSAVTVTYDASASQVEKKPVVTLVPNSGGVGRKMNLPVTFHQSAHEQKKFSFACLDKAEKNQFESIVFPAQFQSHAIVPKAIVDASQKFLDTNPIHMKVIRVLYTTLSPEIVQQYEEALKSWTNGQESGFLSKAKAFVGSAVASAVGYSDESKSYFEDTPSLESEVTLDIFGKTNEAILKAEQQIRETVKENFIDLKIEHEHIAALSAEGLHEISSIAASSNVKIGIDQERKSSNVTSSVLNRPPCITCVVVNKRLK
uniref:Macro domain-containing protein n=1 Tax=Amphimedon queenslandica TaxID=400682 RepID=A0A1X7U0T8_AMPQE